MQASESYRSDVPLRTRSDDLRTLGAEVDKTLHDDYMLDDYERFKELLPQASVLAGITDVHMAVALDVSRQTASRWRRGVMIPARGVREQIYKFIQRRIATSLAELTADRP